MEPATTPGARRTDAFEQHRSRLHGIAYRMLGSRAEAEDIVQEAWLRWNHAASGEIRSPKAWLITATTRLCIDRLRQLRADREVYVGPWLPEPLTLEAAPPADHATERRARICRVPLSVLTIRTDGRRILDVYAILNPDKLKGFELPATH